MSCDQEAPVVGIRWLMGRRLDQPIGQIQVRLGTTRGTNALLERKGAATALITTAGFADLVQIGDQTRPRLFDLRIRKAAPLCRRVIEMDERVDAQGRVLRPLDEAEVGRRLAEMRSASIEALAVCLLNSYRNSAHELGIERAARRLGFEHVSVSSQLAPLQRILPRSETTLVDAYLTPAIRAYVAAIRAQLPDAVLKLMTSAGGLVDAARFVAKDSILSGPAAGVVGCARIAETAGFDKAIGLDMGGTSTDVSRFDGQFERRYEMELEDRDSGDRVRIVSPMLAIETVAAGGGSICDFDGVKPIVGPQSAGADPGPACYGRGGPLCLTDVNVYLGRIPGDALPFPLDRGAVQQRLDSLVAHIEGATGQRYSWEELSAGYVAIANARMAAAIKKISIQRGYDPREHILVSFGGAGGQHACAIANDLGIRRILLHPQAGVLSAYGIGLADVTATGARDVGRLLDAETLPALERAFDELETDLRARVRSEGIAEQYISGRRLLDLRYEGQDSTITVAMPADGDWRCEFERLHLQLYGFTYAERAVQVYAARVEMTGRTAKPTPATRLMHRRRAKPTSRAPAYFDGQRRDAPVYRRDQLRPGDHFAGPAIVLEPTSTIVVEPSWSAMLTARGEVLLTAESLPSVQDDRQSASDGVQSVVEACDPVTLELFNSHFANIAEQMGATLQKTALSTNVKERLDFSCAIYDAEGDLVAHAPHIPVHLGAMGQCVKCLIEHVGGDSARQPMRPGEVYVTNDPYRGGSHLPDVTVVTPVFDESGQTILFFAASRAHHAEIGGVVPGSMPPMSCNLAEEGVLIEPLPLVVTVTVADAASAGDRLKELTFREQELRRVLTAGPYPSRAVEQNLADIRAQVAANRCGVRLLQSMVRRQGLALVHAYMEYIQQAAETKMRAALRRLPDGQHAFTDYLDDGAPIAVKVIVNGDQATVDFTGTAPVRRGNLNATPAIVGSAVLYCFRCLIDEDIPLNAGVLRPVRIILPQCLLNPPTHDDPAQRAAVAGGNVETSQRIVDAIFGALNIAAASQGTMNNLAFGSDRLGYYETIGGGAGAGPDFDGTSAVHTHMTNTRLTDPEVLEDRYPVRLRRFAIRRESGGPGRHRGGDGIVREIEFLKPLDVSLLTQRRTRPPYGLAGGQPGQPGRNRLLHAAGRIEELAALSQLRVAPGDVLIVETPGGGGYGHPR
ncbi:MAG: hydantoinase B/oxoprolinase family protein [Planctomycetota bacterium]